MEKTFKLEQKELAALEQMQKYRDQVLAQYGALSLEMRTAEQRLSATVEHQQSFLKSALLYRGVEQHRGAQIVNGSIVVTVADEEMPTMGASTIPPSSGQVIDMQRVNGAPAVQAQGE
jgi:hypothetical protein